MTYTFAILDISPASYAEIREKLVAAGYQDQFHEQNGREVIDMHGIAIAADLNLDAPGLPIGVSSETYMQRVERRLKELGSPVEPAEDDHDMGRISAWSNAIGGAHSEAKQSMLNEIHLMLRHLCMGQIKATAPIRDENGV